MGEIQRLDLNDEAAWSSLLYESCQYSLFSEHRFLNARLDKKTLSAGAKTAITRYLEADNPQTQLLIEANVLAYNQINFLVNHPKTGILAIKVPDAATICQWINTRLQACAQHVDAQVARCMYQYTQGNLLACSQLIDKIALTHNPASVLTVSDIQPHLSDEAHYTLFELSDACLQGNAAQALVILRRALENKQEPVLILWALAQEIRNVAQLLRLTANQQPLASACAQLKIWSSRVPLYHKTLQRLTPLVCQRLHAQALQLDTSIKTGTGGSLTIAFEQLILLFCLCHPCETA